MTIPDAFKLLATRFEAEEDPSENALKYQLSVPYHIHGVWMGNAFYDGGGTRNYDPRIVLIFVPPEDHPASGMDVARCGDGDLFDGTPFKVARKQR